MSTELKVGVVVLIAIGVAAYFILQIEGPTFLGSAEEAYEVRVVFDSIAGLTIDSPVRLAGVGIGRVDDIDLTPEGQAEVTLQIRGGVQLRQDATASVASLGLLGEKYLELTAGTLTAPLVTDGGEIQPGAAVSIDQMVAVLNGIAADVQETTTSLSNVFGTEAGETRMQAILDNVEAVTRSLDQLVRANRDAMTASMTNVEELTAALNESLPLMVADARTMVQEATDLVKANEGKIGDTVDDVRDLIASLDSSASELEQILTKINSGDGTMAQLINTSDTIDKANAALDTIDDSLAAFDTFFGRVGQTQFSFSLRSEWYATDEATKNYFGFRLDLSPRRDRGFIFELVDDNVGLPEVTTTTTETLDLAGNITDVRIERELARSEDFKFSAMLAGRFGGWQLRGGLMESKAGLGFDYFTASDRLRFTLEGWDFGRNPDPHLKLSGSFDIYDRFFILMGGDDLLSDDFRQYFVGGGFRFR